MIDSFQDLADYSDGDTEPDFTPPVHSPDCSPTGPCDACILAVDRCEDCGSTAEVVVRPPGASPIALCLKCAATEGIPRPIDREVTSPVNLEDLLRGERAIARARGLSHQV